MTVNILLAGPHQSQCNSLLQQTVQSLQADLFLAADADEILLLYNQHNFALLIVDESTLPRDEHFPLPPPSPATTILTIIPSEQKPSAGLGAQGEYLDSMAVPLTPSLLLARIHTLLHIHHLKQELCACQQALQEQINKSSQYQQSLVQQKHYLDMLSVRDGLTGLFNRRHLSQTLEQELRRARTMKTDLTMLLIDIDYFKETNRISGQIFGDSILNEFSARLTQNTREDDICFRFGGSDFIVLLPQTDMDKGLKYAERLRLACANKPFTNGHKSRSVTVSIGLVTLFEHHPEDQDEFINMAERARYQAKAEGRNRVVTYNQDHAEQDGKIDTVALLQQTLHRILEKTKENSIASLQILTQNVSGNHQDEHVQLATQFVQLICDNMGLPKTILETFSNGLILYSSFRLLLHRELLSKKERFNYDDRKVINDLPYKLAELTQHFDYFSNERNMLLSQGEHYDGSGYPEGLAGEDIPLASRIFSLADGLAAMSADRPHRKRLSPAEILSELASGAGTQWDPSLVLMTLDILQQQKLLNIDDELILKTKSLVSQKIAQTSSST